MKSADNVVAEYQRRVEDTTSELQSSRTEIQRLTAELAHARSAADDMHARSDAAGRDNKQLAGSLNELSLHISIYNSNVVDPTRERTFHFYSAGVATCRFYVFLLLNE